MRDDQELQVLLDKLFGSAASRRLLLSGKEVSVLTGRAEQTLANDRTARRGLPYVKLGRSVKYLFSDVLAHIKARRIDPEAQ
jgi:3-deoxy-D-manno-octulosonate 8-phosphate phosphatase KdsC-like HAD superfamily phosphatase